MRKRPILLHYYLTYKCDCHCRFCDIWRSDDYQKAPFARLDDVERNLFEAQKLGVKFVDFTGGEPLLHPELPKFLNLAQRNNILTSITSSCLNYPERANELKGLVNFLHFSIDSLVAEQHNAIRGTDVFDKVLESIDIALNFGERPDLLFTITEQNANQLPHLVEFAQKLKLVLIVNPVFSHKKKHNVDDSLLNFIESFSREPYVYVNKAFNTLRRAGGNNVENPRCRVVFSTIVVSPDNHMLLPCFHFFDQKIPISDSLYKAFHSAKRTSYKQRQGTFVYCNGCNLNCYFDPSFNYKMDVMFFSSIFAKTKYAFDKYIRPPGKRPKASYVVSQIL